MLPHRSDIWVALPKSFVLFRPKDIVSGDFYFFYKKQIETPNLKRSTPNAQLFLAVADCTGHGVPGAFMSLIGSGKLHDAVAQSSDPSEILSFLNLGIKTALKQTDDENSTRDGMDIALVRIDYEELGATIHYAAANRPIWIVRKNASEMEEIKPTKRAIGGFTDDNQQFENHEIQLQEGDSFYISTDGFADQFGGATEKKLMTKKFKEILLSIQEKSMKEQEEHLNTFIEKWKNGREQIDDILVIGVRV